MKFREFPQNFAKFCEIFALRENRKIHFQLYFHVYPMSMSMPDGRVHDIVHIDLYVHIYVHVHVDIYVPLHFHVHVYDVKIKDVTVAYFLFNLCHVDLSV